MPAVQQTFMSTEESTYLAGGMDSLRVNVESLGIRMSPSQNSGGMSAESASYSGGGSQRSPFPAGFSTSPRDEPPQSQPTFEPFQNVNRPLSSMGMDYRGFAAMSASLLNRPLSSTSNRPTSSMGQQRMAAGAVLTSAGIHPDAHPRAVTPSLQANNGNDGICTHPAVSLSHIPDGIRVHPVPSTGAVPNIRVSAPHVESYDRHNIASPRPAFASQNTTQAFYSRSGRSTPAQNQLMQDHTMQSGTLQFDISSAAGRSALREQLNQGPFAFSEQVDGPGFPEPGSVHFRGGEFSQTRSASRMTSRSSGGEFYSELSGRGSYQIPA